MFDQFIQRENNIFDILQIFNGAKKNFVVVGGYGVSAYMHRYSMDADVVIKGDDVGTFEELLRQRGYTRDIAKALDHVYASAFYRYTLKGDLRVHVDLLIDGIGSRTTGASFSFEELVRYAKKKKIMGLEKEVIVLVPRREVLIVLKLHAGRLTDFRDIAALSLQLDLDLIQTMIWRGKTGIVKDNIRKLVSLLENQNFMNSFKGVFEQKKYGVDKNEIVRLKALI